jgi:hypothetical protein
MTARGLRFLGLSACCGALLNGCETSPSVAFPTAQTVARAGAQAGTEVATLAVGRKIYTTSCTECHVARPVPNFSVQQWRHIVGKMAPRAHLNASDRAALEAYLIAARESLPQS